MAKEKVMCPFSNKLCKECALYRGRHLNLCYIPEYRGYLGGHKRPAEKESFAIPAKITARPFDPYEILLKERKGAKIDAD